MLSLGLPEEHLTLELEVPFNRGSGAHRVKVKSYSIEVMVDCSNLEKIFSDEVDMIYGSKQNSCNVL